MVNITDQTIPSEVNEEEEVMDDEKILNELQQLLGPDTSSSPLVSFILFNIIICEYKIENNNNNIITIITLLIS